MVQTTYSDLLKDPRWQKKRLEIFQRDDWTCQMCGDKHSTLHIHHIDYIQDILPWDYPDELLITLCEQCHDTDTKERAIAEQRLISMLRRAMLTANSVSELTTFLEQAISHHAPSINSQNAEFTLHWPKG